MWMSVSDGNNAMPTVHVEIGIFFIVEHLPALAFNQSYRVLVVNVEWFHV
jgi:hypothetical protein